MESDPAAEIREQMTRHWLSCETSIRAYVATAIRSVADREDVVQQVALTIARRFEEYDHQRPFLAWALWLAKSRIIDYYRTQTRQRALLSDDALERLAEQFTRTQQSACLRLQALENCLEKLPQRSRSMIQYRYRDDLPIDKIADSIKSTPGTVRVALYRIRNALAQCIEDQLAKE